MMPTVLSNFIYRPKRKNKALVPPFQIRHLQNASPPLDPYATPPVLDINDGRMTPDEASEADEAPSTHEKDKEIPDIPPMKLDLEFNDEPLGNLFPLNFLKPDSPYRSPDRAPGQSTRRGPGANGTGRHIFGGESSSVDEREDDDDEASSSEAVLANLEAMDATAFINVTEADETNQPNSMPSSWRKLPPAPIRIPSYGHKTHLPRSREPSRPTSLISSVESSAVSGTTLARALMANSFAFSADHRGSRYRSGVSLVRADSATLPRGEFSLLHSPHWRERTNSGGELTLSPSSALSPPVPPVPDNAELVYVPPKAARHTPESRSKRYDSATVTTPSDRGSDSGMTSPLANGELQVLRRTARVPGQNVSPLPKPHDPAAAPPGCDQSSVTDAHPPKDVPDQDPKPLQPVSPPDPTPSPSPSSLKQESDKSLDSAVSPVASEPPSSGRDIDNVLDYYSLNDNSSDIAVHGFRPAFSPISEETSSQVSPASAYRRDPKKTPSTARSSLNKALSPFSAGVRVEWALHQRRGSDPRSSQGLREGTTKLMLPIGERPRSIQISPSSSAPSFVLPRSQPPSTTPSLLALSASESDGELAPPSMSTIFNRQRSGSTPSPIQVVRDIHDDTTYNITVTAVTESSTPSTVDGDVRQTFPETPSALSPAFSTISAPSPGAPPQTPMSAGLPLRPGGTQHSLSQQIMLTRAATSGHGERPYSRPSVAKKNRFTEPSQSRTTLDSVEEPADDENAEKVVSTGPSSSESPESPEMPQNIAPKSVIQGEGPSGRAAPLEVVPAIPIASEEIVAPSIHQPATESNVSLVQQPVTPLEQVVLLPAVTPLGPRTPPSSRSLGSGSSARSESPMESPDLSNTRPKGLPRIPPSPKMLPPTPPRPFRSAPPPINEASTSGPSSDIFVPTVHRGEPSEWPPPRRLDPIDPTIFPIQASNLVTDSPAETQLQSSLSRPLVLSSIPSESHPSPAYSPAYHSPHASFGSPPPYHTVVGVPIMEAFTPSTSDPSPSTSGSQDPNNNRYQVPNSSSPNFVEFNSRDIIIPSGQSSPSYRQSRGPRTRPSRPPLPAGPRRPSQSSTALPLSSLRSRGGSLSSLNSNLPSGSSSRLNTGTLNLPSLKFETPPPRWKGFTLDAAKWTFTSAQLQGIVSRAIRQSAEPSSIRLLRLETLDDEIPPEIQRLEIQKSDIILKYKVYARRRANIMDALSVHVDGSEEGSGNAIRLVEELKEVSVTLDRLTEELHSTDAQLAQLSQLCITHSSSALAMALRKLNSSFLRQFAEAQTFRNRVEALEAERDEAWKHAEDLAMEYEELRGGKVDNAHPENRFSRVLASRKSSLRASQAGLRPSSRRYSYRSSMCSNRAVGGYSPSSSRTPQLGEDIPPVPRISRHRPSHIRTDIPMQNSVGLSVPTSALTPNSDTRALARAQEDLYDMLGITIDDNLPRRPRSLGSQPEQFLQFPVSANPQSEGSSSRRASLPGSAQPDLYNSLTADVSIMLTRTADRAGWI